MHPHDDAGTPRPAEVGDVLAWLTRAFPGSAIALARDERLAASRFEVTRHGGRYFLAISDAALARCTDDELQRALARTAAAAYMVEHAGRTMLLDGSLALVPVDG